MLVTHTVQRAGQPSAGTWRQESLGALSPQIILDRSRSAEGAALCRGLGVPISPPSVE